MYDRSQPLVSIIIPSWFTKNHHGRYGKYETFYIASECLSRLLDVIKKDSFELIIIDNGSELQDSDIEQEKHIKFTPSWYWEQADILIKNEKNLGFGPAVNQGISKASGKYIVQMNNDILIWGNCFKEILDVFSQPLTPPVGMVMPALEKSGTRFPEILKWKKEDVDMKTNADKYGLHAQFGSMWCMKKSLLEELFEEDGFYFDPQFEFLFKEDRDLYARVYAKGYESYRAHRTRVHHVGNVTVSKVPDRKEISKSNREKFKKKWGRESP